MTQTLANRAKSSRRERRAHERAQRRDDAPLHAPQKEAASPSLPIAWPVLLLFISGAASLIYQVLWIKQLALVVGVEVQAVTTGVSAFFAGLAVGGWVFGRLADRLARPVASLRAARSRCAGAGARQHVDAAACRRAVRFAARSDRTAWPGRCPLSSLACRRPDGRHAAGADARAVPRSPLQMGRSGARLYAANTAGAIAGTLAASFVLIPSLGVQGCAFVAAALNAGAALVAALVGRTQRAWCRLSGVFIGHRAGTVCGGRYA